MLSRLLGLGAMVTTLALLAAACSGDRSGGPKGTPQQVVGSAPAHTATARTGRIVIDGSNVGATGTVDYATGVSRLELSDGSTVVLAGGEVYRRAKGATSFTRATAADLPESLRSADPVAALDLLHGATFVRSDGGMEVRGASTFAYTVRVDPAKAVAAAAPDRRAAVQHLVNGVGSGELHLEVAVDGQGRIRRIQLPTPLRVGPPAIRYDGEPVVVTLDVLQYGVPADATIPAA